MRNQEICPNCWGYQEYGSEKREVKVDADHKTMYYGRLKKSILNSHK